MEYVKLGDYCTITSSKRIFADQYVSTGIPFYRSKEIIEKNNNQIISEPLYISVEIFNEIKNKFGVPKLGDILLTSVGTLGIPYLVKDETFYFKDGNLTWMKDFSENLISKYVYYWLSSSFGKQSLLLRAIGSSQPAITIDILKKYKIALPPLPTQRRIASILSAYDNLIENNNKRIRLLEQMAENLYKEWFVRFRFPGHEKVEMENGLPKGWKVERISNICETIGGGTPSTEKPEYWGGEIKWVTPTDITSKNSLPLLKIEGRITEEGLRKSSAKLLPPFTILMTSRASIGFFGISPYEVCTNQGFISIIPNKDCYRMYLLYTFKARKEEIIANANGSTFLEISKGRFRKLKILMPIDDLLDSFEKKTRIIFDEIMQLEQQSENLTRQRDLLLPRLMSGKLEVK